MSLPPWNTKTRKRPRRLTSVELPSRKGSATTAGGDFLYESHDVDSLLLSATERIVRPLPPMSVLAAMPPRHRGRQQGERGDAAEDKAKMSPLLQDWLASVNSGKRTDTGSTQSRRQEDFGEAGSRDSGGGDDDDDDDDDDGDLVLANDKSKAATKDIEPIDDSSKSSLSREQHARYLRLLAELTKAGRHAFGYGTPKAKEFRTLEKAVTAERTKYQSAMEEFRGRNVERFLLGFRGAETESASQFTAAGEWKVSRYRQMWKASQVGSSPRPVRYGKCVQEISLPSLARAPRTTRGRRGGGAFDLGSYSAQIVHSAVADALPRIQSINSWLNQDRSDIAGNRGILRPAKRGIPPPTCPISEDVIAAKLAVQHKVDVVMTAEGFFELLTSSDESARWIIPASNPSSSNDYIVMEEPTPKRATTREWLSRGYKESVFESVSCSGFSQKEQKEQTDDNGVVQEVYTLLTLPRPRFGLHDNMPGCKVLVRTTNSLLDGEGRPLHIGVRLEYFHEREVTEGFTHHERSVWLAQKLLQPDSRVLAVRVDPNSSHVVSVSEMSVAHALAGSGGGRAHRIGRLDGVGSMFRLPDFDASLSFGAVADVLHAVTKLERSGECQYVLCLPGRDLLSPMTNARTTVSVHRGEGEAASQSVGKHSVSINIDDELDEANAVYTSKVALMSCYLPWEWNNDDGKRVPYTFPLPQLQV